MATSALLVFSRVFGLSLVLPNFRGHYEGGLGFDPFWVGVALGAHGLAMAGMQLPMGLFSDRYGRKPALLIASALFVGGSIAAAFVQSPGLLVAARFCQGLGSVASVAMAAVGESVADGRRTQAMALIGIPAGIGFMAGMATGPVLFPLVGMQGLFLLVAAVGLAAALPVPALHFAAAKDRPLPAARALSLPVLGLMLAGFSLNYFLYTTLFFLPTSNWRTLVPILAAAFVFLAVATRVIDRAGLTWQPAAAGLVLLAFAAPAFALGDGLWLWFAGAAFFSLHATLNAVIPSQVSRLAGAAGGRGHGLQNIFSHGGTFVAGAAAGALAARPGTAFFVAGILAVLASGFLVGRAQQVAARRAATPD